MLLCRFQCVSIKWRHYDVKNRRRKNRNAWKKAEAEPVIVNLSKSALGVGSRFLLLCESLKCERNVQGMKGSEWNTCTLQLETGPIPMRLNHVLHHVIPRACLGACAVTVWRFISASRGKSLISWDFQVFVLCGLITEMAKWPCMALPHI